MDHRERLIAAMIETASSRGYAKGTVARVVELAGVSKATFYEHFDRRASCFAVAYRHVLEEVKESVNATAEPSTVRKRPGAVLDTMLARLAADPAGTRLVLVEALAAPPTVNEHEQLVARLEHLVGGFLDSQADDQPIQISSTALVGGIGEVLIARAIADTPGDLAQLGIHLRCWINSYRLPIGRPPLPQRGWRDLGRFAKTISPKDEGKPVLLPRGASALPGEMAARARRDRILDATARTAAHEGYGGLTVARIAAAARLPRAVFYSHFKSKAEALEAAQAHSTQGAIAVAAAAYAPPAPWPVRVWRAVDALLRYVAEKPDYGRLDFVESFAAGPAAIRLRQHNQMVFALFLEEGYRQNPAAAALPRVVSEAVAGAVFAILRSLTIEGRIDQMPSLVPVVTYTIVAPFIGPDKGFAQVQALTQAGP